jgi:hypothetical protein
MTHASELREQQHFQPSPAKEELSMSTNSQSLAEEGTPTLLASGDPALANYFPAWLNNLADDVTLEGSMMDGAVQGAEAVRTVLVYIRKLYERQEFRFAGPYGEKGFLEDYTAWVRGEPIGNVVQIFRNDAGQTQHIVGNYRPRSTLLLLSQLVGEHFAGTPSGEHFASNGD